VPITCGITLIVIGDPDHGHVTVVPGFAASTYAVHPELEAGGRLNATPREKTAVTQTFVAPEPAGKTT
jgi:hypothetical protein